MAHKFRELMVWQRAMVLVTDTYKLTHEFPHEERFGLTSQLRRAAVSIPLNIAEGSGSDSPNEFARFLTIALRSTYETMTALELSERLSYTDQADIQRLLVELDTIAAMLTGLIKHLRADSNSHPKRIREPVIEYDTNQLAEMVLSDYRLLVSDFPVTLRAATDADVPTIVALIHAAFQEYNGAIDPPSGAHKESEEKLRQAMKTERAVLALLGDQALACVLYRDEGDHMYFGRLAVLPAYRNRGIAAVLIAYVEARARELGLPRVRLGVRVALPHLRTRYERLGYRMIEERRHAGYAQPTYLVMEKLLSS
jgi:four helix bundle protein